jgi:hypothetical protein
MLAMSALMQTLLPARDRRTFRDVAGRNCDTELPEGVDQCLLHALQFGRIGAAATLRIMRGE